MMCYFKTLHYCRHGYVAQCDCCSHIRTVFGNIRITQAEDEFQELVTVVSSCFPSLQPGYVNKSICIQTPAENIRFVFTVNELEAFSNILQQANLLLEANKILYAYN